MGNGSVPTVVVTCVDAGSGVAPIPTDQIVVVPVVL